MSGEWLTNIHKLPYLFDTENEYIRSLINSKVDFFIGKPKRTDIYTDRELVDMGMVGVYRQVKGENN